MIATDSVMIDGKSILLEALDARSVRITTNHADILERYHTIDKTLSSNKLVGLNIADRLLIDICSPDQKVIAFSMGGEDDHKWTAKYDINYLKKLSVGEYMAQTMKLNNCAYFLLPMLGHDREWFAWDWSLANVSIGEIVGDKEKCPYEPPYTHVIILKTRYYYLHKYTALEARLISHPNYLTHRSVDYQHMEYIFTIPDVYVTSHRNEFKTLLKSQYSEFSPKFKKQIIAFHNFSPDGSMAKILAKDDKYRQQLELELKAQIAPQLELFNQIDLETELIPIYIDNESR